MQLGALDDANACVQRRRFASRTVLAAIRRVIGESPFTGEGYRKVVARRRAIGVHAVRRDHGSEHVSDAFQREIAFRGIASPPAFVYAPGSNGVIERSFGTLKAQLLWWRITVMGPRAGSEGTTRRPPRYGVISHNAVQTTEAGTLPSYT